MMYNEDALSPYLRQYHVGHVTLRCHENNVCYAQLSYCYQDVPNGGSSDVEW